MMNQLQTETSPYLQQHASNPVDWFPWGHEALEKARRENKPILLSIGYSACHWCHVMAHESFEDATTAQWMNKLFINIKVDREERPDLDKIYQTAHAMMTQKNGGWPLTMFLSPNSHIPFFGGTYFPKTARYGLPGFTELIQRVADFYQQQPEDIQKHGETLNASLNQALQQGDRENTALPASVFPVIREQLGQSFDPQHGGFGTAPKFPHPSNIERLLRHGLQSIAKGEKDSKALQMVRFTLKKMALGGLNDQLGGGFCRYSVDDLWMIPHFEKMLYDNGPLLALYAQCAQVMDSTLFQRIATETANWVIREMQSSAGGYYSSLDADSEGEEGRFYIWDKKEIQSLLDDQSYRIFARRFGFDRPANFEGRWYPHVYVELDALAEQFDTPVTLINQSLQRSRDQLLKTRNQRVWPGRDEKILTSWNAMMIRGMAIAGRQLNKEEYTASAGRALDFIQTTLWRDQRLLATCKDGKAHLPAYLDDYAFLIDAILELLQNRWRNQDLRLAISLADTLLAHFQDEKTGGFFFTADDHETLIQRPKAYSDDSLPNGNAVAASALIRLGHLIGEPRYLDAAEHTLQSAARWMKQSPMGHCAMLNALDQQFTPPTIVILRTQTRPDHLLNQLSPHALINTLIFTIPTDTTDLPDSLTNKSPQGKFVAYLCSGQTCSPPIDRVDLLIDTLNQSSFRKTDNGQF